MKDHFRPILWMSKFRFFFMDTSHGEKSIFDEIAFQGRYAPLGQLGVNFIK